MLVCFWETLLTFCSVLDNVLSVSHTWSHLLSFNGNSLWYSCLENPRDGGAWWAAVSGVAQSQTQLKQLSSSNEQNIKSCNAGNPSLIPGLGRSPEERNGNPLQYSCLEIPMDRGTWWGTVHGVTKSWTWLSNLAQWAKLSLAQRNRDERSKALRN